ncbi:MAG: insulinase family protein [Streptococcaceae bacterium]|jgi:predicted Zn-dependent peptidase|nr:insulinase family protein [Streptococcaceae bacterium]
MSIQLNKGVNFTYIPSKKFKTVEILIRFQTSIQNNVKEERALLSRMMSTSSLNYPQHSLLTQKLADLYGASLNVSVSKKGQGLFFNVSMSFVDDQYLSQNGLTEECVDLLKEILFQPQIENGLFPEKTFELEKENLKHYFQSAKEDKAYFAEVQMAELFFHDSLGQATPSYGEESRLKTIENAHLVNYYREMMATDEVDILVLGDVDEKKITELFRAFPFADRLTTNQNLFYSPVENNLIREKIIYENVEQSQLSMGYRHPIRYDDGRYYALHVFNGIFGGFPHSKLFQNIRERDSLAYTVSSSFDSFRGLLRVRAGIEKENRQLVMKLIYEALQEIEKGEFSEEEVEKTKLLLKSSYLISQDSRNSLLEQEFMKRVLPFVKRSNEEWTTGIENVTPHQIQDVAKTLKLAAVFFLGGNGDE